MVQDSKSRFNAANLGQHYYHGNYTTIIRIQAIIVHITHLHFCPIKFAECGLPQAVLIKMLSSYGDKQCFD